MANFTVSHHDVIGPPKTAHVVAASYQRIPVVMESLTVTDVGTISVSWGANNADGATATDAGRTWFSWQRANADAATVADARANVVAYGRVPADTPSTSDAATRVHTAVRGQDDAATAGDVGAKLGGFARAQADGVVAADTTIEGDVTWRRGADTVSATDVGARTTGYAPWFFPRFGADTVTATDAVVESDGYGRAQADGATATDVGAKLGGLARVQADTATAGDATVRSQTAARAQADGATVADALVKGAVQARAEALTVTVTCVISGKVVTYVRGEDDTATAGDAVVQVDGTQRLQADTATVADTLAKICTTVRTHHDALWKWDLIEGFSRAVTFNRGPQADTATVADALTAPTFTFEPRYVTLRHIVGQNTFVVQHRDWSHGAFAGPSGARGGNGGSIVVLRRGGEERILAESFAMWAESAKSQLGFMMQRGVLNAHEDYLNTTRQLNSWQVAQYVAQDAPWTTWVQHRSATGAPLTDDVTPVIITNGTLTVEYSNIRIRLTITGGTNPTCSITPWLRERNSSWRGPWVAGPVEGLLTSASEFLVNSQHREVWLQCHNIAGSPTNITTWLSGTSA